jgi:hypothetical protein
LALTLALLTNVGVKRYVGRRNGLARHAFHTCDKWPGLHTCTSSSSSTHLALRVATARVQLQDTEGKQMNSFAYPGDDADRLQA